jgi:large subunit ribosomal protein L21
MYAVIRTGGKQYKVEEGDKLQIEKVEANKGDAVTFDDILFVGGDSYLLGKPRVEGASVQAEVVRQMRAKKIIIFKMRRRKSSKKKQGHRQYLTEVCIKKINPGKGA